MTAHDGLVKLNVDTRRIQIDGEVFLALSETSLRDVVTKTVLSCTTKKHKCRNSEFCGKTGNEVGEHTESHFKCHPNWQNWAKIQGVCIAPGCSSRNATKVCLKCSSPTAGFFLCSSNLKNVQQAGNNNNSCYLKHIEMCNVSSTV